MTKNKTRKRKRQNLEAQAMAPASVLFEGSCTLEAAEGKPSTFSIHAYTGEKLSVKGFKAPVVVELASAQFERGDQTYINRHHDQKRELGHSEQRRIDATGIHVQGVFSHDNEDTREIITAAKRGKKFRASIEAAFPPAEFVPRGKTVSLNNQTYKGPVYVARQAVITGVAILTRAADMQSNVSIAAEQKPKSKGKPMNPELREFIEAQGFDPAEVENNETQLEFFQAQFDKFEQKRLSREPINANREQAAAEAERIADVQRICANARIDEQDPTIEVDGENVSLCAHAIRTGMSAKEVELESGLWKLDQQTKGYAGPGIQDATKYDNDAQVIECALALSNGGFGEDAIKKHKFYDEKTVNLATSDRFQGYRPSRLAHNMMAQARIYAPVGQFDDNYIDATYRAQQKLQAAGNTTMTLSSIFRNAVDKTLLAEYMRVPSMVEFFFSTESAPNFKPIYFYRVENEGMLEELGPDGEIKHGKFSESEHSLKLTTKAKMLSFDRHHMINDDMGALMQLARGIGGYAYKTREFMATQTIVNSSAYSVGNGNDLVNNDLSIDGLTASKTAFALQTDSDGLPIGVGGHRLLVPTELAVTSGQLQVDTRVEVGTSTKRVELVSNPHSGTFEFMSTAWLSNEKATGNDPDRAKRWYAVTDPLSAPAFVISYLNGRSTPTVQSDDSDFRTLGMQYRIFWDLQTGEIETDKWAQRNTGT